ncbi:MAG: hypothetical protein GY820_35455 [Gammaproteobacteria bacterium]|nr:hypothetical protein [Gammaproteobacteria bacterium]
MSAFERGDIFVVFQSQENIIPYLVRHSKGYLEIPKLRKNNNPIRMKIVKINEDYVFVMRNLQCGGFDGGVLSADSCDGTAAR